MQIKYVPTHKYTPLTNHSSRIRTLTGKEIELDIEPDYKVSPILPPPQFAIQPNSPPTHRSPASKSASKRRRESRRSSNV